MTKFAFIGAGSYGTAVAHHFASREGYEVLLCGRDPDVVEEVNSRHLNSRYLCDIPLSPSLRATTEPEEALDGADCFFMAVPAQSMRSVMGGIRESMHGNLTLISLAKGIEIDTRMRMSEVISESVTGTGPRPEIMSLSGPSFARDVVDPDKSVALSLGGKSRHRLRWVRALLHSRRFRVFGGKVLAGVEGGGGL